MIYVVELTKTPEGWRLLLPDSVHGSEDFDRVGSLDGFDVETMEVDIDDRRVQLPVYQRGAMAFVRMEDLPTEDPDDDDEVVAD